jgi:hypothetical protein
MATKMLTEMLTKMAVACMSISHKELTLSRLGQDIPPLSSPKIQAMQI